MRKFALFASFFAWCFLLGNEEVPIDISLLETREINGEEIFFLKDKQVPYSGTSLGICEDCEVKAEIGWKDGRKEGTSTHWYNNGQKSSEISYKYGEKEGLETQWYPDGTKK